MFIFGEDIGENRISMISTAAILNFGCKTNCPSMREWHHADLGSVWFVLPESPIKHCMYAKMHPGKKSPFCHQTTLFFWVIRNELSCAIFSFLGFSKQTAKIKTIAK